MGSRGKIGGSKDHIVVGEDNNLSEQSEVEQKKKKAVDEYQVVRRWMVREVLLRAVDHGCLVHHLYAQREFSSG